MKNIDYIAQSLSLELIASYNNDSEEMASQGGSFPERKDFHVMVTDIEHLFFPNFWKDAKSGQRDI